MVSITNQILLDFELKLKELGENKFYKKVLGEGVLQRSSMPYPEIDILNTADCFFKAAKSTGNEKYFIIGKLLRKAAHRLYRDNCRNIPDYPRDGRFLTMVK